MKTVRQVAALPFVVTGDEVEVLLVTSRRRGRWIVPKGWPMRGRTLPEAACHEAMEEAGVRGLIDHRAIGSYRYAKRMRAGYEVGSSVLVYPLLVLEHRLEWDERRDRTIAWHRLSAAAGIVDDRGLARLIARLARDGGAGLRALAGRLDGPAPARARLTEDA